MKTCLLKKFRHNIEYPRSILFTDENPEANNERVSLENHDPMVVNWNIDNYCNPSNGPSMEQFHMIVKQGCCFLQKFPFISVELLRIGILH